jgi:hypothetical protein
MNGRIPKFLLKPLLFETTSIQTSLALFKADGLVKKFKMFCRNLLLIRLDGDLSADSPVEPLVNVNVRDEAVVLDHPAPRERITKAFRKVVCVPAPAIGQEDDVPKLEA